jgi:cytochrome bd-type quinol oxidase subunit 2
MNRGDSMKPKPTKPLFPRILAFIGLIVAFLVPVIILPKLARPQQSIYAAVCGIVCLATYYIGDKVRKHKKEKNDRDEKIFKSLVWCGIGELIVAIFFAISTYLGIQSMMWGYIANFFLSLIGYPSAFSILIISWFPQIIVETKPITQPITPPDPLAGLPNKLRKIMHEARTAIDVATIRTAAIYVVAIVIMMVMSTAKSINPLGALIIGLLAIFPIVFIVRYFTARKWQGKARQLGISERELQSAAKLAGLPWPKIKEE